MENALRGIAEHQALETLVGSAADHQETGRGEIGKYLFDPSSCHPHGIGLETDPLELKNLADVPEHRETLHLTAQAFGCGGCGRALFGVQMN